MFDCPRFGTTTKENHFSVVISDTPSSFRTARHFDGVSPFSITRDLHVRPVAGFPGPDRPRARPQRSACVRGQRGAGAKEKDPRLKSCTDSANDRTTAAPRRLNRGADMLLYPLFGYAACGNQASSHATISSAAFRSSGLSMMLPGTFASPATCAL